MKLRAVVMGTLLACAIAASIGAPPAESAKKKARKGAKPAPAVAARPDSVRARAGQPVAAPVETAPESARVVPPGHTTIAPFPVPGDTGRDAAERRKLLNVPKPGGTTLATPPGAVVVPAQGGTPSEAGSLPKVGDYVYVDELPEAITRVAPNYPEAARKAGTQGTVILNVLVDRDGKVADTRIASSVPGLDDAAAAAVRQWRFKPAMERGSPVAVWVIVPVKFSLH